MPSSNEILSQMTLRSVKGSPLSNDEMDKNLMLIAALPSPYWRLVDDLL